LYGPLAFQRARRARLADEDARDVAHDVVVKVIERATAFQKRSDADSFRRWLNVIITNAIRDKLRLTGQGGQSTLGELDVLVVDSAREGEERADFIRSVYAYARQWLTDKFEQRTWRAFEETVVNGRSTHETAELLGGTPNAVRVAKCRVLRRLRELAGEMLNDYALTNENSD
jgi:RNA polymerase sigma-70 factor (ECF subfamily)